MTDDSEDLPPCPYGSGTHRKRREVLAKRQWFTAPELLPVARWPVTYVLLSGGIGDYTVYLGIGSPQWVADHGNKVGFEEALAVFPRLDARRYRT